MKDGQRLRINRETVRYLTVDQLSNVGGGGPVESVTCNPCTASVLAECRPSWQMC